MKILNVQLKECALLLIHCQTVTNHSCGGIDCPSIANDMQILSLDIDTYDPNCFKTLNGIQFNPKSRILNPPPFCRCQMIQYIWLNQFSLSNVN